MPNRDRTRSVRRRTPLGRARAYSHTRRRIAARRRRRRSTRPPRSPGGAQWPFTIRRPCVRAYFHFPHSHTDLSLTSSMSNETPGNIKTAGNNLIVIIIISVNFRGGGALSPFPDGVRLTSVSQFYYIYNKIKTGTGYYFL